MFIEYFDFVSNLRRASLACIRQGMLDLGFVFPLADIIKSKIDLQVITLGCLIELVADLVPWQEEKQPVTEYVHVKCV